MKARFSTLFLMAALVACGGGSGGITADSPGGSDTAQGIDAVAESAEDAGGDIPAEATADAVSPDVGLDVPADLAGESTFDEGGGTDLPTPGACCASDAECPTGLVCAKKNPGTEQGVCKPKPEAGHCFNAADCPKDHLCDGAHLCPCDADCPEPDHAGTCRLKPGCCLNEIDCGEGDWECVSTPEREHGVCKSRSDLGKGQCWGNHDCAPGVMTCKGAEVCPCGASCDTADVPGKCVPVGTCCLTADDCASPDMACVPTGDEFGVCKSSKGLDPGRCWTDADCGPVGVCKGVVAWPCNADLDTADSPGTCQLPTGCCLTEADCGEGAACMDLGYEYGVCRSPDQVGEGKCWIQEDCGPDLFCVGAFIPACWEPMPLTEGICKPLPSGCCESDADCGDGQVCRGLSDSLPGRCVEDPGLAQCPADTVCCWQNSDCPVGQTCKGASVCGCIALCPMCSCAPDQLGVCTD